MERRAGALRARSRFLAALGMTARRARAKAETDAEGGEEGESVAADDRGGGVGEPEEGEGDRDIADGA